MEPAVAERLERRAREHVKVPRLEVASGRRAARDLEDLADDALGHGLRKERTATHSRIDRCAHIHLQTSGRSRDSRRIRRPRERSRPERERVTRGYKVSLLTALQTVWRKATA